MIKLSKRIDGTYYIVEAVPDTNARELAIVSAYIEKATEQQTRDVQAPFYNVRNASAGVASNETISQNLPIVNNNYMQDGENDTQGTDAYNDDLGRMLNDTKAELTGEDAEVNPLNTIENNRDMGYNSSTKYSFKRKSEQYGVMWTLESGILDDRDVSAFYDIISETHNNKYPNFHTAFDGQLIYEIDDKLIYTDGDYDYPLISKVVKFNTQNSFLLEYGKECFYDGENNGYKTDSIVEIIEAVLGEGTVETTTYSSYEANKRSKGTGNNGTVSSKVNRRGQKNVINGTTKHSRMNENNVLSAADERKLERQENIIDSNSKVNNYLRRARTMFVNDVEELMNIPKVLKNNDLKQVFNQLWNEYKESGKHESKTLEIRKHYEGFVLLC